MSIAPLKFVDSRRIKALWDPYRLDLIDDNLMRNNKFLQISIEDEKYVYFNDAHSPFFEELIEFEKNFFSSKISAAPAENREGLEFFLDIGGFCIMQLVRGKVEGCVEIIEASSLLELKWSYAPYGTTICRLLRFGALGFLKRKDLLVYGWLGESWKSMRLIKELSKIKCMEGRNIVGFVLVTDSMANKRYGRLGHKIRYIERVYSYNDPHWLYEL